MVMSDRGGEGRADQKLTPITARRQGSDGRKRKGPPVDNFSLSLSRQMVEDLTLSGVDLHLVSPRQSVNDMMAYIGRNERRK